MKLIALITVSLLSLSSFAELSDFSCSKQDVKKIEEQKLLRDIDKSFSSITENHRELLPSESLNVHSFFG